MGADACSLPVSESSVQGEEGLVKSGGNSDPLNPFPLRAKALTEKVERQVA